MLVSIHTKGTNLKMEKPCKGNLFHSEGKGGENSPNFIFSKYRDTDTLQWPYIVDDSVITFQVRREGINRSRYLTSYVYTFIGLNGCSLIIQMQDIYFVNTCLLYIRMMAVLYIFVFE